MKFIAGNTEFMDNIKQLLPDFSIFGKIINDEPSILENKIWKKQIGLDPTGIKSGSLTTDDIFYRSCYMIYKSGDVIIENDVVLSVENVMSGESISLDDFKN